MDVAAGAWDAASSVFVRGVEIAAGSEMSRDLQKGAVTGARARSSEPRSAGSNWSGKTVDEITGHMIKEVGRNASRR